jgi:hypothetical protein
MYRYGMERTRRADRSRDVPGSKWSCRLTFIRPRFLQSWLFECFGRPSPDGVRSVSIRLRTLFPAPLSTLSTTDDRRLRNMDGDLAAVSVCGYEECV